ncbi:hypothetical protein MVEN_02178900 [Mycena venus]|uniref:F-box domain-containing protein n=1 Tax=Mycena venus TaxID=2733690 RepID=A0A8H6X908_9AGAR|nr:hypothetical protein MVEN_02178900 [Mycena venus]
MSRAPIPYLAMIPSEIWLACWSLCSARQLRRLSLSVDTHDLMRGPDWSANIHRLHRAAVRLERIADGPRVRMVRSWTFATNGNLASLSSSYSHITDIGMVVAMYERVVTAFSSTLGRYQHLCSLNIREFLIDKPFRDTLVSLPMLEEVTLGNCDIPARDGALLNLKFFSMSNTGRKRTKDFSEESLELVSPGRLQTLKIDGCGDTVPLMVGFGGQRFSHLTQLSVDNIFDLDLFLRFLTQCPRLQCLSAGKFSRDGLTSLSSHVHPETMPFLRSIDAPLGLVRALTPNRPVRDVTVQPGYSLSAEDFTLAVLDISNASVPVRSLTLPSIYPTLESLNSMSSLFPGLTSLSMEIRSQEQPSPVVHVAWEMHPKLPDSVRLHEVLSWICSGLVSLPAEIEVLRFPIRNYVSKSTELSVEHQHQVVAALSRMYPSLRELEMGYHNNPHWVRNGALWKRKGVNSYIQVHR